MKKNDIILVMVLLLLAGAAYMGLSYYQTATTGKDGKAVIYIDGVKHSEYPLKEDREFTITFDDGGMNVVKIEAGYADVISASCPDKTCVNHRKINKNGQTIVCLPHKLVVQIENGESDDLDGVSQ